MNITQWNAVGPSYRRHIGRYSRYAGRCRFWLILSVLRYWIWQRFWQTTLSKFAIDILIPRYGATLGIPRRSNGFTYGATRSTCVSTPKAWTTSLWSTNSLMILCSYGKRRVGFLGANKSMMRAGISNTKVDTLTERFTLVSKSWYYAELINELWT